MAFQLTYEELSTMAECLAKNMDSMFVEKLRRFLSIPCEDYYFYSREPIDTKSIEISKKQIKRIANDADIPKYFSLNATVHALWKTADQTNQDRIFLYGRSRK